MTTRIKIIIGIAVLVVVAAVAYGLMTSPANSPSASAPTAPSAPETTQATTVAPDTSDAGLAHDAAAIDEHLSGLDSDIKALSTQ